MTYYSALHYATKAEAAATATAPVVSHLTEIDTVANNISDVSTVAGVASDVSTVSGIASDVSDVADNETNINTVAGISSDVTAVAGISSDVTTVANNTTAVSNVSTYMSSVRLCADDISNINTVAVDISNVVDVADNKTNIDTVAADISDVSTVAANVSDVNTVAGISSDVSTVASNVSDISTVATDIANVNAVAGDLTNIDNASTYAAEAKQWAIGDPSEPVDGSAKYWAQQAAGQVIPSQTGHSGEFLTTDGSALSWDSVDALPSQTGQSGKYLTTDGSTASWGTIQQAPSTDNITISLNASDELQTIGVINSRDSSTAIKTWTGTKAQYDAIVSKDSNTLYNVTDDTDVSLSILEALYPVGSIYITTNATCPLSTLIAGSTWVQETSRILVDKGSSGTDWWELYSDGWCEQGGEINGNNNTYTTVIMTKTFANTNYTIVATQQSSNASYVNTSIIGYYNKQAGSFGLGARWVASNETPAKISWQASGYTSTTTNHKRFRRTA